QALPREDAAQRLPHRARREGPAAPRAGEAMSDLEQRPLPNFYDDDPDYVPPNMTRGCPYCHSDETFLVPWRGRIRCTSCEARYDADAKLLIERPKPVDD